MSMTLTSLLHGIAEVPATDVRALDLTLDSREVRPGSVFIALRGLKSHGLEFAADAIARGAHAILWEPDASHTPATAPSGVGSPAVFSAAIPGLSGLLGRIAHRFFGEPSAQMRITAITGTNGKTTCAYLLAQCLECLHMSCAYIGTIGWGRIGALAPLAHTTPDVISVHRMLAQLRDAGVHDVAMEVSSHALEQGRVDAVHLHTAAFTNLTRDHLDYHGSMQAYGTAKARLFAISGVARQVIHVGDAFGAKLAQRQNGVVPLTAVWVGAQNAVQPGSPGAATQTLHAARVDLSLHGITLELEGSLGQTTLSTRLLGRFNAENALVVLACVTSLGIPLERAAAALACAKAPPGRMEVVDAARADQPLAVVDYAHTPDALEKALGALREHCSGTLWCVFGCGGDRDAGKRPLMGAVVDEFADSIIVTDDNPRSEDPARIAQDILAGIRVHPVNVIHDRAGAIAAAITAALAGDVVLIAGKGHEDYQICGGTRRSFSDRAEVQRVLEAAA